jgi:S-DNA-T family DNA segregation ATPase FtsK/SpoIIIE
MAGSNLSIDMRVDGPHVLVAGTTGAGKSELLQSFISALALSHSPRKINFLLVDYKGGAAFKECKDLPHSVGLVTDLNTQEVRRVLISLNAEIHRRERLLNRSRAKDLIDYEKMGLDDTPANLLIIIDEFAALAKEVPEFVTGVVDVAQRGRSLGMHLVLATQRPAGVITDNIRANTNLRIALRVADDNESVDVIGTHAAGRIDRATPGRGVARVGPKEVLSFQAGYVGGYTSLEQRPVEIVVRGFAFDGLTALATQQPTTMEISLAGDDDLGPSDLQRIVDVSAESCSLLGIGPPHRPWLDPLPAVSGIETLTAAVPPVRPGEVLVGIADDPEHQAQHPATIDLASTGSVLVVGTGRSGKTAFLRTVAASIVLQPEGEPMDVYGLDFAGRGLSMLDPLPHVGAIVDAEDSERVVRLFRTLQATITARADRFADAGVGDLREYHRRTGERSERRIVVLLDGFQAFEAAYEKVDRGELVDLLPRLISGGRSAGVHFVISADRRGSVRGAVFGLISTVLVLRQSSPDELSSLNLRPDAISLEAPPGRGYLGSREVQLALLGDPEGDGQATAIRELADRLTGVAPAAPVLRLPSEVNRLDLPPASAPGQAVVGLDGGTLNPTIVDLLDEHLCVFGPRQSGRTTTLAGLARSMTSVPGGPTAVLCTPGPSKLADAAPWARTAVGAEATAALIGELTKVSPADLGLGVVVFLDDFSDFGDSVEYPFVELLGQTRRLPVHFVVAAETRRVRVSYSGSALGELRHVHRGLLLQPSVLDDGDLFDVRLSSSATMRFPPGRGFLVTRTDINLVQVALP